MKLEIYTDRHKFYYENIEWLQKEEALNNLIIANMVEALNLEDTKDWTYGRVTKKKQVELIFLRRPPFLLLMYSPTKNQSDELYEFLAKKTYKIIPNLPGVNSEVNIAQKFARSFAKQAKKKIQIEKKLCILKLDELNPINLAQGVFRKAKKEDLETIITFFDEFYEESLGHKKEKLEIEEESKKYLQDIYLIEKDGEIVSQALEKRKLSNGGCVSGVYTKKTQRGKGYAATCVYNLSKKMLDEGGKYCVLYTDAANPISNHVYEKIGYKKISDQIQLMFVDEVEKEI